MAFKRNQDEVKGTGMGGVLTTPEEEKEGTPREVPQEIATQPITTSRTSATPTSPEIKEMPKTQKAGTGGFANLRSYLQAAQGGGQQRVAQAAGQRVQRLGSEAQESIGQAKDVFSQRLRAGSGQFYQGTATDKDAETAANQAVGAALGTATGTTYTAPTQQYFTPEQEKQFQAAITASYQGPESLESAGLYQQAAEKARAAQEAAKLTQSAAGRQQLLTDVFGRTRDYTRGASALDALLLNTSGEAVKQIQEQAQPALEASNILQAEQNISANTAAARAARLAQIQKSARERFTGVRSKEEKKVEQRLNKVAKDWDKLSKYFQDLIKKEKVKGTTTRVGDTGSQKANELYDRYLTGRQIGSERRLTAEEAAILGLREGQSLFDINEEAIKAAQMNREQVVTKDEIARQLALQRLAQLDPTNVLRKDLKYTDLKKAGTQDILKSLDVSSLQREMAEREEKAIKELLKVGNLELGPLRGGDKKYNLYDLLQESGFIPSTSPNVPLTQDPYEYLKNIAEGGKYKDISSKELPSLIENLYKTAISKMDWGTSKDKARALRREIERIAPILMKTGVSDRVTTVGGDVAKARAEALRKLLGEIT